MTASAHLSSPRRPATAGQADVCLPWWALALPALAFCALLVLMVTVGAYAAPAGSEPLTRALERLHQALIR